MTAPVPKRRKRAPLLSRLAAAAAGALDSVSSPNAERVAARALPPTVLDGTTTVRREPTGDELRAVAVSGEEICERARQLRSERERALIADGALERMHAAVDARRDAGELTDEQAQREHASITPKSVQSGVPWEQCLTDAEQELRLEIWNADMDRADIEAEGERAARELDAEHGKHAVRTFNSADEGLVSDEREQYERDAQGDASDRHALGADAERLTNLDRRKVVPSKQAPP